MGKLKTKSSAKKRFKVTGTGLVLRRKCGQRHLLEHESSKTKRNRRGDASVSHADSEHIKRMLPGI